MNEHTKEPWKIGRQATVTVDKIRSPYFVSIEAATDMIAGGGIALVHQKQGGNANADRIVACVNACAAITTEQLEAMGSGGVLRLVEACKAFIEAWQKSLQLEKTDVALRLAKAALAPFEEAEHG